MSAPTKPSLRQALVIFVENVSRKIGRNQFVQHLRGQYWITDTASHLEN
jgi:hypothetical protein